MITTNLNQICQSAYSIIDPSVCVTLFSVGNAVGRVLAGWATFCSRYLAEVISV